MEVVNELGLAAPRIAVVVAGDDLMSQLHERFGGTKGSTDVLTFDLSEPGASPRRRQSQVDGEIYICLDEAKRRAGQFGHAPRLELLLYAVHGLLHLLGYDDHTASGYRRMHRKEDQLLRAIGLGDVFAPRTLT